MKISAMFGSSSRAVAATIGAAILLVAGAIGYSVSRPAPEQTPPVTPPQAEELATPEAAPAAASEQADIAGPSAPDPTPSLDIVRVEADGTTLIAGASVPGATVVILLDGEELAVIEADGAGDFVGFVTLPPSDSPRMISVEVRPDTGPAFAALETVLVAPFALPEADEEEIVIAAAPDPVPEADAADPAEDLTADRPTEVPTTEAVNEALPSEADQPSIATDPGIAVAPDTSPAPTTAAPELATDQSPAVLIAGPEGLRISQPPGRPEVLSEILLDAISYDASGAVILAGRGPATADIQVMINNQPIQLGEVGPDGAWSLQLPDVDPGTYTLSVAELAEDGSVASQIETPFLREDPERIAEGAAAQGGATGIDVITVQPGFTLWGIAERNFGDGIQYVQIFEENRDQIRDPNWIFPGQIFRLPEIDPDAPEN